MAFKETGEKLKKDAIALSRDDNTKRTDIVAQLHQSLSSASVSATSDPREEALMELESESQRTSSSKYPDYCRTMTITGRACSNYFYTEISLR